MKHLRYMEALVRHGHFGRAAEACHISQPALSIQIRELEAILGAPLIERGARRIRPTRFGEVFAARAAAILQAVDELGDLARLHCGPFSGPFRLGVIPTIAPYLLPAVIETLGVHRPGIALHPHEALVKTLVAQLLDGQLDAAIVALPISEPSLTEHVLFEEEFVLVRPVGEAGDPVPTAEAFRQRRLLLLQEGHCFRDQALSYCRLTSSQPGDVIEASSLSTLVQLVASGLGSTLLPDMAVAVESRAAAVCVARLQEPRPRRTVGMVWRKANPLADQFEDIATLLAGALRSRAGTPVAGQGDAAGETA